MSAQTVKEALEGFATALQAHPDLVGYTVHNKSVNADQLAPRDVLITDEGWENPNDVADQFQIMRFKMAVYVVVAYDLPLQTDTTSFDIMQKHIDISKAIQKTVFDNITDDSGYGYINLTMGGAGRQVFAGLEVRWTTFYLEWEEEV